MTIVLAALLAASSGCIANMADLKTDLGIVPAALPAPVFAPPIAKVVANATAVKVDAPVLFAAEGSRDPQDLPLSYGWTFADGAVATGAQVTHVYQKPGDYKVTLTVTNPKGLADTASLVVQVAGLNHPPVAALSATDAAPGALSLAADDGATHAMAGDKVAFDATRSSDPDADPLLAAWDFGDGGTAVGAQVAHVYAAPGRYVAALTVTDPSGASSRLTRDVAVSWSHADQGRFGLGDAATKDFALPLAAGARSLTVTITYDPSVANDLSVALKDAAGKVACASESGLPQPGATGSVTRGCTLDAAKLASLAPGAWTAEVTLSHGVQVDYAISLQETV
jgi:PKD repeat protein